MVNELDVINEAKALVSLAVDKINEVNLEYENLNEKNNLVESSKNRSERISGLIESVTKNLADELSIECNAPKNDALADFYVGDTPFEIKTSTGRASVWRGGKFSKRPGYYFMIRYKFDPTTKKLRFFVSFAYLKKSDWKCPSSAKENYYATFIDLYNLSKCKDFEILRGSATTKVKNTVFHSVEI